MPLSVADMLEEIRRLEGEYPEYSTNLLPDRPYTPGSLNMNAGISFSGATSTLDSLRQLVENNPGLAISMDYDKVGDPLNIGAIDDATYWNRNIAEPSVNAYNQSYNAQQNYVNRLNKDIAGYNSSLGQDPTMSPELASAGYGTNAVGDWTTKIRPAPPPEYDPKYIKPENVPDPAYQGLKGYFSNQYPPASLVPQQPPIVYNVPPPTMPGVTPAGASTPYNPGAQGNVKIMQLVNDYTNHPSSSLSNMFDSNIGNYYDVNVLRNGKFYYVDEKGKMQQSSAPGYWNAMISHLRSRAIKEGLHDPKNPQKSFFEDFGGEFKLKPESIFDFNKGTYDANKFAYWGTWATNIFREWYLLNNPKTNTGNYSMLTSAPNRKNYNANTLAAYDEDYWTSLGVAWTNNRIYKFPLQ